MTILTQHLRNICLINLVCIYYLLVFTTQLFTYYIFVNKFMMFAFNYFSLARDFNEITTFIHMRTRRKIMFEKFEIGMCKKELRADPMHLQMRIHMRKWVTVMGVVIEGERERWKRRGSIKGMADGGKNKGMKGR